jgi:alcohol dehydrogenase (cytochrome c)/quinohemoprotein ethanol dehydrogenase
MKLKSALAVIAGMALLSGCDNLSEGSLADEMKAPGVWMSHGRTYAETRHSPLTSINLETVGDLGLAWYDDLDTRRGQEATPLFVDGVLYITSAWSKVYAYDARSGEKLWSFDPEVPGEWAAKACCDVVNRGVAYEDGKIFFGSLDGRLFALDAKSGEKIWETDTIEDRSLNYTITGAPRVVDGRVFIGNGGGEFFKTRGYVSAYSAETGELDWRFYTVPGDPSLPVENEIHKEAAKTWSGEWWTMGGGGTVWDSMAYDEELGLLYIGVGNGAPWNRRIRSEGKGDNLFLSSIVALDAKTGEYVWHYQTTPGDQWDYTATQQMILADMEIEGEPRKVIMQAPKNGFFYVLDRATGEFISAEAFVPVSWASGIDPQTGRPNINPEAYYDKTGEVYVGTPGPMGGHSWHSMSYNPHTGLVYIPAMVNNFPYTDDDNFSPSNVGVKLGVKMSAGALPNDQAIRDEARRQQTSHLLAWDPIAQKEVWRVEQGAIGSGGTLSTAGNLVFQGNRNGTFDAFNAQTGERVWSFEAQTGVIAAPMTYEIDGEQYIAVLAGWGGTIPLLLGELSHGEDGPQVNRSRFLVFKLGGTAQLPEPYDVARSSHPAPPSFGTPEQIARGGVLFADYCTACHGGDAVSGGVLPDLRSSFALSNEDTWFLITRDGGLKDNGMIGFGGELSDDELTAVRAYIVHRAHESGVAKANGD